MNVEVGLEFNLHAQLLEKLKMNRIVILMFSYAGLISHEGLLESNEFFEYHQAQHSMFYNNQAQYILQLDYKKQLYFAD